MSAPYARLRMDPEQAMETYREERRLAAARRTPASASLLAPAKALCCKCRRPPKRHPLRRGRCGACYEHLRKYGVERPLSAADQKRLARVTA